MAKTKSSTPSAAAPDVGYSPPTKGFLSTLPASWVPYAELMRLEKPHGVYMVYFPHVIGLLYGSSVKGVNVSPATLARYSAVLFVWCFLLRGAGCAWNDFVDQDFDRKTTRCRTRPVARGAVTSTQANVFAAVLVVLGFWSVRGLPIECTYVGIGTMALTVLYPFGKRFTNFAQVILGSTLGSTVALSAYAAGLPALNSTYIVPTLCLTFTIMLLVVFYDVVYARQDTADDIKSGVKGMAVRFRNSLATLFVTITASIAALMITLGKQADLGEYFYIFSVAGMLVSLVTMIFAIHLNFFSSWTSSSGWLYAAAIANLLAGFVLEYAVHMEYAGNFEKSVNSTLAWTLKG